MYIYICVEKSFNYLLNNSFKSNCQTITITCTFKRIKKQLLVIQIMIAFTYSIFAFLLKILNKINHIFEYFSSTLHWKININFKTHCVIKNNKVQRVNTIFAMNIFLKMNNINNNAINPPSLQYLESLTELNTIGLFLISDSDIQYSCLWEEIDSKEVL